MSQLLTFGELFLSCRRQEDQNPDFGTTYTDFGARQYSPTLRSWMTPDPMSEKYYGTSPYAFCGNNPVNFVDPDGRDWKDKVAGYGVGFITNLVPGTGSLRDRYSPSDPSDYNIALRDTDLAMIAVGENLTKAGGTMIVGGGALAVAGITATVTTAGTGVIVAGPVTIVGADIAATGAGATIVGLTMMANSATNQSQGYKRGKSNISSGNKNSQHANLKAKASAKEKYETTKKQYDDMRSKPNKNPEDKKLEASYKKQMEHWKARMEFSGENHSQNAKGNR